MKGYVVWPSQVGSLGEAHGSEDCGDRRREGPALPCDNSSHLSGECPVLAASDLQPSHSNTLPREEGWSFLWQRGKLRFWEVKGLAWATQLVCSRAQFQSRLPLAPKLVPVCHTTLHSEAQKGSPRPRLIIWGSEDSIPWSVQGTCLNYDFLSSFGESMNLCYQ